MTIVVRNPRSATEADIAGQQLDRNNVGGFKGLCDHAVALLYGWGHSGAPTAYDHWLSIPAELKHPGASIDDAPFGSLLFWKTPDADGKPGHVAFKRRASRRMYATDGVVVGQVADTDTHQPHDKWGYVPLGWAAPYFPHGTAAIRVANRVWPEPVPKPSAKPVPIWYTVHAGDSLSGIASAHGLTLTALLNLNKPPYRSTPLRASTPIYAGSRVIVGLHK